uniref:Uncharacterized protein n=1 Tax=Tanacetum cinerariifolium TaxID=118510 RepID=A0A6L2MBT2_TANCI|nr:hypothetical protein [Tanacetum cinerariifolium]
MALCTTLQNKVLDLEKIKTTQCNEIDSLKRRVKKLEKKNRSRTYWLKRLYKVGLSTRVESTGNEEILGEDVSKQERRINVIDANEHVILQKVEDDKEKAELKQLMETISDEEEVVIDDIPLAVKSSKIVDWKIHKEGKKSYYQIVRANGKSHMYMIFSQMLKSFDREDLEDLYKLVKARYGSTRPIESMDYLLWSDMKIMFEQHAEDKSMQIYMLVKKKNSLRIKKVFGSILLVMVKLLMKKLNDFEEEYQVYGRIVGIKSLLDVVGITATQVYVNTALMKLVLLMNFKKIF